MKPASLRTIKSEIRVVGIDDGNSVSVGKDKISLVGVVFRGGRWLDGVLRTKIKADGSDVTRKIVRMIKNSGHYGQIRVLMLSKIFFGKSNLVDLQYLFKKLEKPVMVCMSKSLNVGRLKKRLESSCEGKDKLKLLKTFGTPLRLEYDKGKHVYVFLCGINEADAKEILNLTVRDSVPEPLRVAKLIASALQKV